MPTIEEGELGVVKGKIDSLCLQACHQILFGFAEILLYRPSVLAGVFKTLVDDGVKYSIELRNK